MGKPYQIAKIVGVKNHSDRVKEFEILPNDPLEFQPGQYLKVQLEIDGKLDSEEYTIITIPNETNKLSISVDNHPNSTFGKYLHRLEVGQDIEIKGPYGRFQVDKEDKRIVFLTKDIGIASSMGNISYLKDIKYQSEVRMFHFRSKDFPSIFDDRLANCSKELNFFYQPIFREDVGKKAMKKGKLKKNYLKDLLEFDEDTKFYVSGHKKFIKNLIKKIYKIGIPQENVTKELY